jgi:hypothetical protein
MLRLKERYGIDITEDDYNYLCKKVESNRDVLLIMIEKQKDDQQYTYDINFKYRGVIRVVWSKKKGYITTVLERR